MLKMVIWLTSNPPPPQLYTWFVYDPFGLIILTETETIVFRIILEIKWTLARRKLSEPA